MKPESLTKPADADPLNGKLTKVKAKSSISSKIGSFRMPKMKGLVHPGPRAKAKPVIKAQSFIMSKQSERDAQSQKSYTIIKAPKSVHTLRTVVSELKKKEIYQPSVHEQNIQLRKWWRTLTPHRLPVKRSAVIKFLGEVGIATRDEASEVLRRQLGHEEETVGYDEFFRLFVRGIFRVALLDLLASIEEIADGDEFMPLPLKIDAYRRRLMLNAIHDIDAIGLDEDNKGRVLVDALKDFHEREQGKIGLFNDTDAKNLDRAIRTKVDDRPDSRLKSPRTRKCEHYDATRQQTIARNAAEREGLKYEKIEKKLLDIEYLKERPKKKALILK